ncbi:MAG: amidohydrolase family protein [Lachnospiraceae bacterium]|nr:amidohydrolase family protein [Lachnospiraceae bacterium]
MRKIIDAHVHITGDEKLLPKQIVYFTADDLIALMDFHGVEKAVIQQSLANEENAVLAEAIRKYPDRLAGSMIIAPEGDWKSRMAECYEKGMRSVKFEMEAHTAPDAYPHARLNDSDLMAVFDEAEKMGLTVVVDPARIDLPSFDPEGLHEAISSHPKLKFVLCHLGFPLPIDTEERKQALERMIQCAAYENCWVEVSAMPALFDWEERPFPTMLQLLKRVKDTYGSEKLIWGTDIPGLLQFESYHRMIAMFEESGLFTERELDQLFYENACKAYQLV